MSTIILENVARDLLADGPIKLSKLITEARRLVLREVSDADSTGNLDGQLFWPCVRSLGNVGAKPALSDSQKADLPGLSGEGFHYWRGGEQSAREAWLGVKWQMPNKPTP